MRTAQERIEAYIQRCIQRADDIDIEDIATGVKTLPTTRQERRALLAWLLQAHPWVYSQIVADHPEVIHKPACVITYTTAPDAYDGFGTETLTVVGTLDGKPLRKIETPAEHATWQAQRNGSGMYPTYTETEFTHLKQMPWFTATNEGGR